MTAPDWTCGPRCHGWCLLDGESCHPPREACTICFIEPPAFVPTVETKPLPVFSSQAGLAALAGLAPEVRP